jgi:type II secretory pathway component PulM
MSEALRQLWAERTEREQAVIRSATALLALGLAYAYLWLPVTRERDRLLERVAELRAEAHVMERDALELPRLRSIRPASVGLRAAILEASAASQLPETALEIFQPESGTIRVVVASSPSQQALAWVARMQSAAGVRIESVRLTSLGNAEGVKTEALLRETR